MTQAYSQAPKPLERPVYIKAPVEMGLPEDVVFQAVKPLYGIPERGLHWYMTYLQYHIDKLGMEKTKAYPCLLDKRKDGRPSGLVAFKLDDSLTMGDPDVFREEEESSSTFKSKERMILGKKPMSFNGVQVTRTEDGVITMERKDKIDGLSLPTDDKHFSSRRATVQYIGVNCSLDVCAPIKLIAPVKYQTTA